MSPTNHSFMDLNECYRWMCDASNHTPHSLYNIEIRKPTNHLASCSKPFDVTQVLESVMNFCVKFKDIIQECIDVTKAMPKYKVSISPSAYGYLSMENEQDPTCADIVDRYISGDFNGGDMGAAGFLFYTTISEMVANAVGAPLANFTFRKIDKNTIEFLLKKIDSSSNYFSKPHLYGVASPVNRHCPATRVGLNTVLAIHEDIANIAYEDWLAIGSVREHINTRILGLPSFWSSFLLMIGARQAYEYERHGECLDMLKQCQDVLYSAAQARFYWKNQWNEIAGMKEKIRDTCENNWFPSLFNWITNK